MLLRSILAAASFGFAGLGGADGAMEAIANSNLARAAFANISAANARESGTAFAEHAAQPLVWTIDADGDGVAEYSNPTHAGVRGVDAFGSGAFGAIRDAGKRDHHGVDYIAQPGAPVRAPISGEVTHIGYAYSGSNELRFVEITDPATKTSARVLYVAPSVTEGVIVAAGDDIGVSQDLGARYPGITNHVHVELRDADRRLIDASTLLPSAPVVQAQRRASAEAI